MRLSRIALGLAAAGVLAGCSAAPEGPLAQDYADLLTTAPSPVPAYAAAQVVKTDCGANANGHRNVDNFIATPGQPGAAHHEHEYVGNVSTNAMSTDASLAAAETTCPDGNRSTYYWPVLRLSGGHGHDLGAPPVPPSSVAISYRGSPAGPVVGMPRFLRMSTGAPRAFTEQTPSPAKWSCSGLEDRVQTKYPVCPGGARVVRIFDFPGCWDGRNTDSANHRAHLAFADAAGVCPARTFAIPRLRVEVSYDVPQGAKFAIDSFPEQRQNPGTDHSDFANVMTDDQMAALVERLNGGRR
ncbi:DUF1996 domain-containing protein [Amycolatopsis sp. NPDC059657]|uniref:DUF1996 domain-containing protein n=1 Tax=Amycolatopsis sp. NPDC059657 TaxID=3346899 RepID=UPI00366EDA5A